MEVRNEARAQKKTVVWTNGCFDILHVGHLQNLRDAKKQGDILVVGLNSDDSVQQLKGPQRPVVPAEQRAEMLAALTCVDYVVVFTEPTAETSVARLQPDVYCKGRGLRPPHGKPVPEAALVEAYGGRIAYLPLVPNASTTDIVNRIRELWSPRPMRRAVCLDRDGTIIDDVGYIRDPEQVRLLPGAASASEHFKRTDTYWSLSVISQESVAVSSKTMKQPGCTTVWCRFSLARESASTALLLPACSRRRLCMPKTGPGTFVATAGELALDLSQCVVIGDKWSDVTAGTQAGCRTVYFNTAGSDMNHRARRTPCSMIGRVSRLGCCAREFRVMPERPLLDVVAAIAKQPILIVGDVMLDEYLWGDVRRISPESAGSRGRNATSHLRSWRSANTAANVVSLGGVAFLAESGRSRRPCG